MLSLVCCLCRWLHIFIKIAQWIFAYKQLQVVIVRAKGRHKHEQGDEIIAIRAKRNVTLVCLSHQRLSFSAIFETFLS